MGWPPAQGVRVPPEGSTQTRQARGSRLTALEAGALPGGDGGLGWEVWRSWRTGGPLNMVGFQEAARFLSGSVFLERPSRKGWVWGH